MGTDIKNVDCSRLGNVLYPEIKKGNEAMKTSEFQHQIGWNGACIKRLIMSSKGCGQMTSNYTYFTNSYFSRVKTYEEAMDK